MKLQRFDGGLNTRLGSHLLPINEAQEYTNIDNEDGTLKPVKSLLAATLTLTDKDRYIESSDSIVTFAKTPIDFLEYQDDIYYSVANDFPQIKTASTEGDLGLDLPDIVELELTTTAVAVPVIGDLTITETAPENSIVGGLTFQVGTIYYFAVIRVDAEGSLSDPGYMTYTPTNGGGVAINNGVHLSIEIGYDYQIFRRVGSAYRRCEHRLYAADGQPYNPQIIGKANSPVIFDSRWFVFEFTGYPYFSYIVDLTALETALFNAGTYSYVATVSIASLGWESIPSNVSTIDILSNEQVSMTIGHTDPADTRIDRVTIYRLGGDVTDFTQIAQIDDPTFPLVYTDREANDTIYGNRLMDSEDHNKPLSGLKNLTIVNGQLCGTIGNILYFSEIGKPYAFQTTNFRDFDEELTGLFQIDAGLLIFSLTKAWLLNTSNLGLGKIIQLSEEFGCTAHLTCTGYRTGCMWHSNDGICISFGGKVELISKEKLGYQNLSITHAKMYNETYWGFNDDGTCYALDVRYKNTINAIKYYNFTAFDDADSNTVIRQVYVDGTELKVLFGTPVAADSYTIFGSTTDEQIAWISPRFIEGAYTDLKTYKDIFIRASAGITIKVYIESEEANDTKDVLVASHTFDVTETYHAKVDHDDHQGYAIYFTVTGTGVLWELEYKAMGRQLGR